MLSGAPEKQMDPPAERASREWAGRHREGPSNHQMASHNGRGIQRVAIADMPVPPYILRARAVVAAADEVIARRDNDAST